MKKIIFLILLSLTGIYAISQNRPTIITGDTVQLKSNSVKKSTLQIKNQTKDTLGFLYNKGDGITEFRRALIKINDTTYIIGSDTLYLSTGTGGGSDNWGSQVVERTTNLTGSGTSGSPLDVNTANISTVQRVLDSITAVKIIVALKLNTADSVFMLANYKHWLQGYLKAADIAGKMNYSDSVLMLDAYKAAINLRQNISDTNTVDATRFWVQGQGYVTVLPGTDEQILFNDGGAVGGNVNLKFNKADSLLTTGKLKLTSLVDNGSTDAILAIVRQINLASNAHSFSDQTDFGSTGWALASYDAKVLLQAIGGMDHYAAFQSRPFVNNGGTLSNSYGFIDIPEVASPITIHSSFSSRPNYVNAGDVNIRVGLRIEESTNTGYANTTYGILFDELTKSPSGRYGLYDAGNLNHYLGKLNVQTKLAVGMGTTLPSVEFQVVGETILDSTKINKFRRSADSDSAFTLDPITGKVAYAKINGSGGGSSNTSIGAGRKIAVGVNAAEIKTLTTGYGINQDSATTGEIKTTLDSSEVYGKVRTYIADSTVSITNGDNTKDTLLAGTTELVAKSAHWGLGLLSANNTATTFGVKVDTAYLSTLYARVGGGGYSGITTGDPLTGGNVNEVLYIGTGNKISRSTNFVFDSTNKQLSLFNGSDEIRIKGNRTIESWGTSGLANFNFTSSGFFSYSNSQVGFDIETGTASADFRIRGTGGSLGNTIIRETSNDLLFLTGAAEHLKISSAGIGTITGNKWDYAANYGANFVARSLVDKNYVDSALATVGGGSMVYPGAGIALSTGSAWGTSITDNSANWNTAYGWGNHSGLYPAISVWADSLTAHTNRFNDVATALAGKWSLSDTATKTWDWNDITGKPALNINLATTNLTQANEARTYNGNNNSLAFYNLTDLQFTANVVEINPATWVQLNGQLNITGSLQMQGVSSPAQFTTDQNDLDPGTGYVLRVSGNNDSRKITSITGGGNGRILTIENIGVPDIILSHDDGASGTDANRFDFNGTDLIIPSKSARILQYDASLSRWVAAGREDNNDAQRRMPIVSWDYMLAGVATANFSTNLVASGTATYVNGVTDHPGYMTITSSTTTNSGAYSLMYGLNSMHLFKGGELYECVFQPKVASNTNTTMRFGFLDATTSADAVDGAYFEIPAGSFAVVGKTSNNSTRTTSATIATVAVNTWYRAQIRVNRAASSITFTLYDANGVSLGSQTNSANIPTAAGREFGGGFIATNVGTTATLLAWLDYQSVQFGAGKPINR